jgi:hypothetical protein
MTIGPPSSTEVVVQLIQDLQTDDYAKTAAAVMFILDYGKPTNHIFDRMTQCIGPVTMLDKEASPIALPASMMPDIQYVIF